MTLGPDAPGRASLGVRVDLDSFGYVDEEQAPIVPAKLLDMNEEARSTELMNPEANDISLERGSSKRQGAALLVGDTYDYDTALGVCETDCFVREELEKVFTASALLFEVERRALEVCASRSGLDAVQGKQCFGPAAHSGEFPE